MMTTIITTPEGEQITIEGTRVCQSSSPEVCYQEKPEIIEMMISEAWHKGWEVRREE